MNLFAIEGYPTIIFLYEGEKIIYNGEREADSIVR